MTPTSPRFTLHRFGTAAELVHSAGARWIAELSRNPTLSTSFLGGRVATAFFRELVRRVREAGTDVSRAHFFWGDERCVPPEHADSNYRTAAEEFLVPLGIAAEQIHRVHGELDPTEAARTAEEELRRVVGGGEDGTPALDIVILGMGEDGHVASLFPGAGDAVTHSEKLYLPVIGPKPPPRRVTLTHKGLVAARQVWVLASGAGKERALGESLADGGVTPLARVIQSRVKTDIYTDIAL